MAISYFDRKLEKPTMEDFENLLNDDTLKLWKNLTTKIASVYPNITYEWEHLSKRIGWFLECKSEEKILFFVVPHEEYFQVNFMFDEKIFVGVAASNLPQPIIKHILAAEHIDRGYSFYFAVREVRDLETVEMLLQMQYEDGIQ